MSDQNRPATRNLFQRTLTWLRSKLAGSHGFAALGEVEIEQIARELQMTGAQLGEVNRSGCCAPKLLRGALRAERLNYGELRQRLPGVLRDLEIHCWVAGRRAGRRLCVGAK